MKTIGLIGGMSAESTVTYYKVINSVVNQKLGGFHSAKCLLYSVDFDEIERCQMSGEWEKSGEILADAARRLQKGGADFLVLCTNTMHKVAHAIQSAVNIPFLHIAEATARRVKDAGIGRVCLLGTAFTMEEGFYKDVLARNGIDVIVPDADDRKTVNDVIYGELCHGVIKDESRAKFVGIINKAAALGARGAILGCTEIGLLVGDGDITLPVFDTALIHAEEAALAALE
ncbi:MAG TPA: aspartate/glutamate racemase family protein [Firmicutes bacterium]|nr:aspartate/glutamate racemase family protein [Bacillota bacterium]